MSKLSLVLQAIIIILLAVIIALIIYYGTTPPKTIKAPAPLPVITALRPYLPGG